MMPMVTALAGIPNIPGGSKEQGAMAATTVMGEGMATGSSNMLARDSVGILMPDASGCAKPGLELPRGVCG